MNVKEKLTNYKTFFFQKVWPDPVWSKVISAVIIAIGTGILILIKSLYENIPIKSASQEAITYFKSDTEINNLLLWTGTFIISWALFLYIKMVYKKFKKQTFEEDAELPKILEHSAVFFSYRLSGAFPGQRGLQWYDAKTAVNRLKIFFQDPIKFRDNIDSMYVSDPIWWFRGHRAMFINKFEALSKTKILLGIDELEINRIAVHIDDAYYKCFIYIEAKGEKQIGLYNRSLEDIKQATNHFGYCWEEYALFKKRPISREHYDDGATIINGTVVETFGSQLRVRYLTDYNIIIAAKESPYNSRKFERESQEYFDNIVKNKINPEAFFEHLKTYTKYEE